MRLARLAVATALGAPLCVGLSNRCLADTITAVADNRSGLISVYSGVGDPFEDSFSITPGGNDFDPITFNECLVNEGYWACMNVTSSYLNLGPGLTTDGMHASGELQVTRPFGPGHALSDGNLSFAIQVSGLDPGETIPFTFAGSLAEFGSVAEGVVSLTGPGVSLAFSTTTSWYQGVNLHEGTYTLVIDANLFATGFSSDSSSIQFDVTLAKVPPPASCGSGAGSCFSAREAPGCNDIECCDQVCEVDSFCCSIWWDGICVGLASSQCAPSFITDPVTNPANGRHYRLASPGSFLESSSFLSASGLGWTAIQNASENTWLSWNMSANVPGFAPIPVRIGLNDMAREGKYLWESGEPVSFLSWAPGEPNNLGNEDSTELFGANGLWKDVPDASPMFAVGESGFAICGQGGGCFEEHGPGCNDESCCNEICFLDTYCCDSYWDVVCVGEAQAWCAATLVGTPIPNPATHHTYVLLSGGSWTQAEKIAASLGGHLVVINSAAENEWLRINTFTLPNAPSQIHIGVHDQAIEGAFQTVNHQPMAYTNWLNGEPNNAGGEDFGMMYPNGKWNDIAGATTMAAVIEIPCVGDLDHDGVVGGADLAVLLGAWGSAASAADLNTDAKTDAADLAILLGAWGTCAGSNACVSHNGPGSDQPGCTQCICQFDSYCCTVQWDSLCAMEAATDCNAACQCGG
ncbi:MAG: hypothetical protein JNL80_00805 [Phycisphaerae bacterium]|jgi:hypothetical protein|nr:hypothetical protein [Phycisphaerae bacterium]